jgi:hypothetical protein
MSTTSLVNWAPLFSLMTRLGAPGALAAPPVMWLSPRATTTRSSVPVRVTAMSLMKRPAREGSAWARSLTLGVPGGDPEGGGSEVSSVTVRAEPVGHVPPGGWSKRKSRPSDVPT